VNNALFALPDSFNEPALSYAPGTAERTALKAEIERQCATEVEIPLVIGGKEIRTGRLQTVVCPHDHGHVLARYHEAGPREVALAIDAALAAKREWESMPWEARAAVFHKVASLITSGHRYALAAATMLGQSKNAYQAEIDSSCETSDFLRYNVKFMEAIYQNQPISNRHTWNRVQYRALEGFVLAVTPFNFTAIAANLATAPAIMGNTVVWKPASTSVLSNYLLMKVYEEAGLPGGVINFVPGRGSVLSEVALGHESFAGLHFTGSTGVFNSMWKTVGERLGRYRIYPRLVGETGGKDYIFLHQSADLVEAVTAIIRAGFEYQGQKCSACSRVYVPASLWPAARRMLVDLVSQIRVGDVADFRNFMNAVIDRGSFDNVMRYIQAARDSSEAEVIAGGHGDASVGYFVEPTVIQTTNPHFATMEEEIFGPVVTVFVYDDDRLDETLAALDGTSPYALTGSIFARDRGVIERLSSVLADTAGNFYINDKCTGAVVGHQPFGGARASGTNDKAGSFLNLIRWTSPRTIKECFNAPRSIGYPFMDEA
jgi:1-pyrroline-5-carboxylate dehydrogenase